MILIVTGSRSATDAHRLTIRKTLAWAAGFKSGLIDSSHELWHGCADGADTISGQVAKEDFNWTVHEFPANWTSPCATKDDQWFRACPPGHRRLRRDGTDFCPAAGPRRNQLMVNTLAWQLDLDPNTRAVCVAFPLAKSVGTHDCVDRFWTISVPTIIIPLTRIGVST